VSSYSNQCRISRKGLPNCRDLPPLQMATADLAKVLCLPNIPNEVADFYFARQRECPSTGTVAQAWTSGAWRHSLVLTCLPSVGASCAGWARVMK
jgi:hypothetical protein